MKCVIPCGKEWTKNPLFFNKFQKILKNMAKMVDKGVPNVL